MPLTALKSDKKATKERQKSRASKKSDSCCFYFLSRAPTPDLKPSKVGCGKKERCLKFYSFWSHRVRRVRKPPKTLIGAVQVYFSL